jgi:hypothetical protein
VRASSRSSTISSHATPSDDARHDAQAAEGDARPTDDVAFFDSDDADWDRAGCAVTLLRFGCGSLILYILMALAVLAVALFSLVLY